MRTRLTLPLLCLLTFTFTGSLHADNFVIYKQKLLVTTTGSNVSSRVGFTGWVISDTQTGELGVVRVNPLTRRFVIEIPNEVESGPVLGSSGRRLRVIAIEGEGSGALIAKGTVSAPVDISGNGDLRSVPKSYTISGSVFRDGDSDAENRLTEYKGTLVLDKVATQKTNQGALNTMAQLLEFVRQDLISRGFTEGFSSASESSNASSSISSTTLSGSVTVTADFSHRPLDFPQQ